MKHEPGPLAGYIPRRLDVTGRHVARLISRRVAKPFGLTVAQWSMLVTLGQYGVLSPGKLCEVAGLDGATVTRSMEGLLSRGLIQRWKHPTDGRAYQIRLTRQGSALRARTLPRAQEVEALLASQLSRMEWHRLDRALGRLDDYLSRRDQ